MTTTSEIFGALHRYWGYREFRPMQERIVRSLLEKHDTCVVMPTGGGKSLCYQLPAVLSSETALVISPLIALMQDQVAQLSQMGIPAAFLNSSLPGNEQQEIIRSAQAAKYRLLYLSPERLARPDTIEWLRKIPLAFCVIDEAHCISEWGHDFRPEYRQLKNMRTHFPDCPIAAFTASATRHVRHDIVEQLGLRDAHKYIASFHRPNLRYIVRQSDAKTQPRYLLRVLKRHEGEFAIVYSPTIKRVDETVEFLRSNGIDSIGYHGRMDAATRQMHQDRWTSGEVKVLVGTVAFGLGINKPDVRAVVHLSLPKSVEQYYQEAGRAGRDGSPADCVMLWQKRDTALLVHFIKQISGPAETERAWQRYRTITGFVDAKLCRHLAICAHFGEKPKWKSCSACDICGCETGWLDQVEAPPAVSRKRPKAPLSESSRRAMTENPLFEVLRDWRRAQAQQQKVSAFVICPDSTLVNICAAMPRTMPALLEISGIGERKAARYGEEILAIVRNATLAPMREPRREIRRLRP